MNNNQYLQKVKNTYKECKRILEIINDPDNFEEQAYLLKKNITLQQAIDMYEFVKDLEDMGIQLVLQEPN